MGHRIGYIWVTDELHVGRTWITEWVIRRLFKDTSHIGHGLGYKYIINELHIGPTLIHNGNGSRMSHVLVKLTTFLIFSKLINLLSRHNPATLRKRKMNVIFDQSEESNPVVSLTTLL